MKNKIIIIACYVVSLLISISGLYLEFSAIDVRTSTEFALGFLFTASVAITIGIIILGEHVGEHKIFAAHHLLFLCLMVDYSSFLMTMGQYSVLESKNHEEDSNSKKIAVLEAQAASIQKSINKWVSAGYPTRAKPAQSQLSNINQQF